MLHATSPSTVIAWAPGEDWFGLLSRTTPARPLIVERAKNSARAGASYLRGMIAAEGILTTRGGMTSHAAVVARGMGKPCVSGAGALRVDSWRNRDRSTLFEDRRETAWSPRLSLVYRTAPSLALSASVYRSFRAPTLNELYRSFRVGNVETLANERLAAERLSGAEAGALISVGRLSARTVAFWMEIDDAIANVTLETTPSLITRQRRNLGRIRSRGLEVDFETRLGRAWKLSAGYLFADSTIVASDAAPELVGLRTPQSARHQGSLELRFEDPRFVRAAVQARAIGRQFDDDQNLLPLGSVFVVDALLSRAVLAGLDAFVAAENLFDERYDVGRTPVRTIGPPRAVRGGLRLRLPR